VTRLAGEPLPATLRIALAERTDPALHRLAALADADVVIDPHARPASADVAIVDDEAMLDPRALVAPRLDGVRLFVWHASIEREWVVPFARTRAAELRAYVVAFDTPRRRAFAVDPDGNVGCGTFGAFELAAFTFERNRTESWRVAPATDVREALVRIGNFSSTPAST
jgi:hypothetical protein